MQRVRGVVARGHRVASGLAGDPRFPAGTIAPQLPFFRRAIPDLDTWLGGAAHPATINLSVPGATIAILSPEHHVRGVAWTTVFPPEDFHLSRCALEIAGARHPAYLYIPDPRTKPDHHQPDAVVELLCRLLPGLRYGTEADLLHSGEAISIVRPAAPSPRKPPPR